uniref:3-hydroxyisobutyryl-CoA hydrolase 1-like n=1 Tax=Fragaria vesca subsp. vesca TaxID=101020 RepID=UPI0005C83F33|nr:PREDICTED: 3-hydroxyisobutyryl-CoA hydrolase 1-like [Fragaria vesca subsp. vesca]
MSSFSSDDLCHPEVLIQENNPFVRTLTLNRPRQLNALSLEMLSRLSELFLALEHDAKVKLVILKGNGKAFCAGGDAVVLARHLYNGDWRFGTKTTEESYKLLYLIATYSKPQVSVLDGVCLGRGAAISISCRFRIATENSIFSVPEVALGGFPDVGASYFLSRLPGFFGEYVALTGAQLDGPEMLACGLATHFVPSTKLALLEEALASKVASSTNNISSQDLPFYISAIINDYSIRPAVNRKGSAIHKMDVIQKCFSKGSVEEILSALEKEAADKNLQDPINGDVWLSSTIQSLQKASPTSLKLCLRSIREGRCQGLGECLAREYRMAYHAIRGKISSDFRNGCTSVFLKKDKIQKWEPCKLELITDQMVDQYFSKLGDDENLEELKLLAKSNLLAIASKL